MKYIINMPDKWESPDGQSYDCAYCPFCLNDLCGNRFDGCTLLNAKKAVEVTNSLAQALQTHDGIKIYAVDEREDKQHVK